MQIIIQNDHEAAVALAAALIADQLHCKPNSVAVVAQAFFHNSSRIDSFLNFCLNQIF